MCFVGGGGGGGGGGEGGHFEFPDQTHQPCGEILKCKSR